MLRLLPSFMPRTASVWAIACVLTTGHPQITSFMRNVANYTDFADIVLLRRLISITYFIPLPADAVVTPITFLVPKRRLADACRGFLQ